MGSADARTQLVHATPGPLAYLWDWFIELHNRRGSGGMGPAGITWPDCRAWQDCMRRDPQPWEFAVIARIDNVFLDVTAPKPETTP